MDTREWLAQHGRVIADSQFEDAGAFFKESIAKGESRCPCVGGSRCEFSPEEFSCMENGGSLKIIFEEEVESTSFFGLGIFWRKLGACARNQRKIEKLIQKHKPDHIVYGHCFQMGFQLDEYVNREVIFYKRVVVMER